MIPPCPRCGGPVSQVIRRNHTLQSIAEFPVRVKAIPSLVCGRCGGERYESVDLERVRRDLLLQLMGSPNRVAPHEARYLRSVLRLTQVALAKRIGIVRVTVGRWETGELPISPQNDFILRGLVLAQLLGSGAVRGEVAAASLGAVRMAEPRALRGAVVLRKGA